MNGRIKEIVARDFPHDCNGDIMTTPEAIRDFAEEIVREAARVANENVGAFTPSCGNFVLDHFGVKR